jgi:hypothetical protein
MELLSKLDKADRIALITGITSILAWWYFKGRNYLV